MATYIKSEDSGLLSYEIQPDEKQTLFANIKDVYPAAELAAINETIAGINETIAGLTDDLEAADILEDLTFTPGANIKTLTPTLAKKLGNVLYLQFTLELSTALAASSSVEITITGLTAAADVNWRIILGVVGPAKFYNGWIHSAASNEIKVRCKSMTGSTWALDEIPTFSAIIPLDVSPAPDADDNTDADDNGDGD